MTMHAMPTRQREEDRSQRCWLRLHLLQQAARVAIAALTTSRARGVRQEPTNDGRRSAAQMRTQTITADSAASFHAHMQRAECTSEQQIDMGVARMCAISERAQASKEAYDSRRCDAMRGRTNERASEALSSRPASTFRSIVNYWSLNE
jgi:hypothetical protein